VTNGQVSDTQTFTVDTESGSSFTVDYNKSNKANDKTQDLVEVFTLDADGEDVDVHTLEKVNFEATQVTKQSNGATVPEGTTVNYNVSVSQSGSIDLSENGDYVYITNAELDGDSYDEGMICIANPGNGLGAGMSFGPNETWTASLDVDTQNTFTDSTVTVEGGLETAFNPSTQSLSDRVEKCPQYPY